MATICQILSTPEDNLWTFELPTAAACDARWSSWCRTSATSGRWPHPPDVMYDSSWPMRQASLLFAGIALHRPDYLELWSTLPADSDVDEVVRNFFIRQPLSVARIKRTAAFPEARLPISRMLRSTFRQENGS